MLEVLSSSAGMTPGGATRKILGPKPLVDLGRRSQVDRTVDHDRAAASGEDLPTRQMQRRHAFLLLDHLGQGDLGECEDHAADTRPVDRTCAHRARLCAGVKGARDPGGKIERPSEPDEVRLRMTSRVDISDNTVARLQDPAVRRNEKRPERVVSSIASLPGKSDRSLQM